MITVGEKMNYVKAERNYWVSHSKTVKQIHCVSQECAGLSLDHSVIPLNSSEWPATMLFIWMNVTIYSIVTEEWEQQRERGALSSFPLRLSF